MLFILIKVMLSANRIFTPPLPMRGFRDICTNRLFLSKPIPLPVRHILSYGGYTEGWATYVEFLSYSYEYSDQRLAKALSCSASYSLALYSLCDIGINYEGWSFKETKDFLKIIILPEMIFAKIFIRL